MTSARTFLRRFGGLLHKEFVQIVRDPSSIAIALVMPVVLLLLIGFGISLDARNVRLGIVDENRSVETAGLFQAFANALLQALLFPHIEGRRRRADAWRYRGLRSAA